MPKKCEVEVVDEMGFDQVHSTALQCMKEYGYSTLNEKTKSIYDQFFRKIIVESWIEYIGDCMSFNTIFDLAQLYLKKSGKEHNDESQKIFDEFFNIIFNESWGTNIRAPKNKDDVQPRIINYGTWKMKMKEAEIYATKKGFKKGDSSFKEAFIQYFYPNIHEAYDESITPSGNIKGKNKKDTLLKPTFTSGKEIIVVPNPMRKQKSALSPDVFEAFPSIIETAKANSSNESEMNEKINHIKSSVTSSLKYFCENVYKITDLEYPKEASNEELATIELRRYAQLVVFTMLMVGIENVLTVSQDQIKSLVAEFAPTTEDGRYNWHDLHNTENRHKFIREIYNVLKRKRPDSPKGTKRIAA